MKKNFTKAVGTLLIANTLLSGGMLGGITVLAEEVIPVVSSKSNIVVPQNVLKSPTGTMEITNFKDWDALVSKDNLNTTQLDVLGRDANNFFVYAKDAASAAQYIDAYGKLGFQFETNRYGYRSMVRQQIDVIAGETYELSFWARGQSGSTKANVIYKIGSAEESIATNMQNVEAPVTGGLKTMRFTATKTGKADVVLGGYLSYHSILGASSVNVAVADIAVKNIDVTPPEGLITNPIYTDANLATGIGEPNTTIIVTNEEGIKVEGQTDSTGAYSVQLARLVAGTTLLIANRDVAGNVGESKEVVVRQGELVKPKVDLVSNIDVAVKGQADIKIDVQVKVIKEDLSEKLYTGVTDLDGNYSINIPLLEYKDVIEVVTSAPGKRSETASIVVLDKAVPTAPVVEKITADTKIIKGTATVGNKVKATYPDGTVYFVDVAANGTFGFNVEKPEFGTDFTFIQVKPSGLEGPATINKVGEGDLVTPTHNELNDKTTIISGVATPNANFSILVKDSTGTIVNNYSGVIDSAGKYSILVSKLEANQTVTITTSKDGLESNPLVVTVKDVTPPKAPILKVVSSSDTKIKGTTEAGAKVIASVNSNKIGEAMAGSDGEFEITISKQKEGIAIDVVSEDTAGNVSEKSTTEVIASTEFNLTVNKYNVGDATLTGTMGTGVSKVRLSVNGVIKAQAKTTSGKYTVENANSFVLNPTDKVEIVAVNSAYAEVNRLSVPVSGESLTDLTANEYKIGDSTLTGKFGTGVSKVRLFVNGEVKAQAIKDEVTGTYSVNNANKFILNPTDKVEVVGVDSQFKEINRISVALKDSGEISLTVSNYNTGDSTLTGKFSKGIKQVRLFVNGEVKAQATKNEAEGTYQFSNVDRFILSSLDQVEVVGVNAQFVEVARTNVKLIGEDISKLTIDGGNTFNISSKKITGSYGVSGHQVRLFVNGEVKAQATKDIENRTFSFNSVSNITSEDIVEVKLVNKQFTVINSVKLAIKD